MEGERGAGGGERVDGTAIDTYGRCSHRCHRRTAICHRRLESWVCNHRRADICTVCDEEAHVKSCVCAFVCVNVIRDGGGVGCGCGWGVCTHLVTATVAEQVVLILAPLAVGNAIADALNRNAIAIVAREFDVREAIAGQRRQGWHGR